MRIICLWINSYAFAILWVEKFVEEGRIRTMGITHSPAQRYDELIANCD